MKTILVNYLFCNWFDWSVRLVSRKRLPLWLSDRSSLTVLFGGVASQLLAVAVCRRQRFNIQKRFGVTHQVDCTGHAVCAQRVSKQHVQTQVID